MYLPEWALRKIEPFLLRREPDIGECQEAGRAAPEWVWRLAKPLNVSFQTYIFTHEAQVLLSPLQREPDAASSRANLSVQALKRSA